MANDGLHSWLLSTTITETDQGNFDGRSDGFKDAIPTLPSDPFFLDSDVSFWEWSGDMATLSISPTSDETESTYTTAILTRPEPDSTEKTIHRPAEDISGSTPLSPTFSTKSLGSPTTLGELEIKHHVVCQAGLHGGLVSTQCTKCSVNDAQMKEYRADRRRKQNRISQRRFREKKEARVQAAQDEVNELKKMYSGLQTQYNHLMEENQQLRTHCKNIEAAASFNFLYAASDIFRSFHVPAPNVTDRDLL